MSLRDDLIEAGAQGIRRRVLPRGFERLATPQVVATSMADAEAALDAMLDKLEEHAEEWSALEHQATIHRMTRNEGWHKAVAQVKAPAPVVVIGLLSVLRVNP